MEKWMLKNIKINTQSLINRLNISEIAARILVNRGITTVKEGEIFIDPKLKYMHDPRLMKDMIKGINIIKKAINEKSRIMIVGDYDVDGVISTYILFTSLKDCGADVIFEIPHRINDGYGINNSIIDKAINEGVNTIITCDNGISATDAIKYAKESGINVVVTDHHDIPKDFDELWADAVINPKQEDCGYPFKELCGAGVAFKFAQVLFEDMRIVQSNVYRYIHILAIATVCDVVDLVGENRIIVKNGLREIENTENVGLRSLIRVAGLEGKNITTYSLGFVLGPCINASGRLDCAKKGVELFLSQDIEAADKFAKELFELNKERKDMTQNGVIKAVDQIEASNIKNDSVLVVFNPDIHESIAGIIAGRLKDKYFRPAILLTLAKHGVKGSGRSIEGYNMFEELSKCKELLGKFGGHPMAAGMSLEEDKINLLRLKLNDNSKLSREGLVPKVNIDMQLPMNMITLKLASEIKCFEPFGKGNPKPVFAERDVNIYSAAILGANQNVLKLTIKIKKGKNINGVYFGDIDNFKKITIDKFGEEEVIKLFKGESSNVVLDLAFNLDINEYMGSKNIQLIITNFR